MVELMLGHDRFCCDLRPLLYDILTKQEGGAIRGLACHPYDVAGTLVARQAGVILTDGFGRPLDCPLDVFHPVHWCGLSNRTIQAMVQPVVLAWLAELGLAPPAEAHRSTNEAGDQRFLHHLRVLPVRRFTGPRCYDRPGDRRRPPSVDECYSSSPNRPPSASTWPASARKRDGHSKFCGGHTMYHDDEDGRFEDCDSGDLPGADEYSHAAGPGRPTLRRPSGLRAVGRSFGGATPRAPLN